MIFLLFNDGINDLLNLFEILIILYVNARVVISN